MRRDANGLTPRQARFVQLYLGEARLNATQAYLGVYGGTRAAAKAHGARLVASGNVIRAVAAAQAEIAARNEVTLEEIVAGLRSETKVSGERGQANARVLAWYRLAQITGKVLERVEVTDGGQGERVKRLEAALAGEIGLEPEESAAGSENEATAADLRRLQGAGRAGAAEE